MKQNLLIDSDLSVGNNPDGEYGEIKIGDDDTNDNNEFWTVDDKKMMIGGIIVNHIPGMII